MEIAVAIFTIRFGRAVARINMGEFTLCLMVWSQGEKHEATGNIRKSGSVSI